MQHSSLIELLRQRFGPAVAAVAGTPLETTESAIRPAQDPRYGDYQCNAAMALARPLAAKPREIAQRIVAAVEPALTDLAEPLEIAGPGFINIRLKPEFLARYLGGVSTPDPAPGTEGRRDEGTQLEDRVGIPPAEQPRRVVVDYSSPNIAKQMHVGHLRSTIIGDVFARVLAFEGHEVIRQNHVGDWGTQFGMLIAGYRTRPPPSPYTHADVLQAIEDDYRAAQERFTQDPAFATEARLAVGQLQAGESEARRVWEQICAASREAFQSSYRRLNVLLTDADVRGESFYNDRLAAVVAELREKLGGQPPNAGAGRPGGRAELRIDQGAVCIFLYDEQGEPRFRNPDGEPLPMIVQKSDGAFLYATTDLAALRYRITELGASRIVYVTDARQKQHFEMLFAAARAVGWAGPDVILEHVTFGSVLGEDRKPLKTRTGQNVKLRELLDEAERRAYELLEQRDQGSEGARDPESEPAAERGQAAIGEPSPAAVRWIAERFGLDPDSLDLDEPVLARTDSLDWVELVMELEDEHGGRGVRDESVPKLEITPEVTFRDVIRFLQGVGWLPAGTVLRVHHLARELGVTSIAIIDRCRREGIELKNHMAVVSRTLARSIRRWFGSESDEPREARYRRIARAVGIAAVKYADLRQDRTSDYVFDWDKLLALQGNTAPYLMYAYARIRSIYRKTAERFGTPDVYAPHVTLVLVAPEERTLALKLGRLRETIDQVAGDLAPHTLCTYLYDVAAEFMRFYEACPVMRAPEEALRLSRLRLCDLTARTLKLGLGLLGIPALERM